MRTCFLLLFSIALTSCSLFDPDEDVFRTVERDLLPSPPGPVVARVSVVGPDAELFRPTPQVWWSSTRNSLADAYAARCTDTACTSWEVTGAAPGVVYVWASHEARSRLCRRITSAVEEVEVTAGSVTEAALTLGPYDVACE